MALTVKGFMARALKALNDSFGKPHRIEYHARRTEADPKKWRVIEIIVYVGNMEENSIKELATDLKRNQAEALVKLLRSNYKHQES